MFSTIITQESLASQKLNLFLPGFHYSFSLYGLRKSVIVSSLFIAIYRGPKFAYYKYFDYSN